MGAGLPVTPIYDLKIKKDDLVAATHGRSFWVLDDIAPLRADRTDNPGSYVLPPRDTIRFRLNWSVGLFDGEGKNYSPAFGVSGTSYWQDDAAGHRQRRHLDVGENPPDGAIIYYWLDDDYSDPVRLCVSQDDGQSVISFDSHDDALLAHQKPTRRRGWNRFVWNLRYPGPEVIDKDLITPKYPAFKQSRRGKPLGSLARPGRYQVCLHIADKPKTPAVGFTVRSDPRITVDDADLDAQFALSQQLVAAHSQLIRAVNRIRLIKKQLHGLTATLGPKGKELAQRGVDLADALQNIEAVLVNFKRETPRDVLRHPAGLDDGLEELFYYIAMADTAPTAQALAVFDDLSGRLDRQLADLDGLFTNDLPALNADIADAGFGTINLAQE